MGVQGYFGYKAPTGAFVLLHCTHACARSVPLLPMRPSQPMRHGCWQCTRTMLVYDPPRIAGCVGNDTSGSAWSGLHLPAMCAAANADARSATDM